MDCGWLPMPDPPDSQRCGSLTANPPIPPSPCNTRQSLVTHPRFHHLKYYDNLKYLFVVIMSCLLHLLFPSKCYKRRLNINCPQYNGNIKFYKAKVWCQYRNILVKLRSLSKMHKHEISLEPIHPLKVQMPVTKALLSTLLE